MRHGVDQKRLGRGTSHRRAMLANMAVSLLKHGRIETTLIRAKALRRIVEKLVTRGKGNTVHDRRIARRELRSVEGVGYLFDNVAPRFRDRKGGYTRILKKAAVRRGDSAEMAFLEFVDYVLPPKREKGDKKAKGNPDADKDKELEKQALAAGAKPAARAAKPKKEAKKATAAGGGPKKSTTVRKISSSS